MPQPRTTGPIRRAQLRRRRGRCPPRTTGATRLPVRAPCRHRGTDLCREAAGGRDAKRAAVGQDGAPYGGTGRALGAGADGPRAGGVRPTRCLPSNPSGPGPTRTDLRLGTVPKTSLLLALGLGLLLLLGACGPRASSPRRAAEAPRGVELTYLEPLPDHTPPMLRGKVRNDTGTALREVEYDVFYGVGAENEMERLVVRDVPARGFREFDIPLPQIERQPTTWRAEFVRADWVDPRKP